MNRTITFNELRKIKDSLPSGSMHRIADELNLSVETVRNFFGGHNFKDGKAWVSTWNRGLTAGWSCWMIPRYSTRQ